MATNLKYKDALLILQKAGISKTSQRLAVLNILLAATMPMSANTIRQNLQTQANIDKVTVYRILSVFKQLGIIREIASAGGANYFEMATLENPLHPHFSCRNCGAFTCLAPLSFTQAPELILPKDDYSIDHIEINISGLCACCRNATEPQKNHDINSRNNYAFKKNISIHSNFVIFSSVLSTGKRIKQGRK